MQRLFAIFALMFVAACSSSPPEKVVQSPGEGVQGGSQSTPMIADYLLVDKSERTLIAYKSGRPIRVYRGIRFGDVPMGHKRFEGDERTPEGVYTIDTRNPQSSYHLSLRISYPNAADRTYAEQQGRSPGGDIFIHGQPNGYGGPALAYDWTDGCIALSNAEIEELWRLVPDGTPIEIRQ